MPYVNPLGMTYDSGDYGKAMDRALALADWKGFTKRRRESRAARQAARHRLANYIELTSGSPRERTKINVEAGRPRSTS